MMWSQMAYLLLTKTQQMSVEHLSEPHLTAMRAGRRFITRGVVGAADLGGCSLALVLTVEVVCNSGCPAG